MITLLPRTPLLRCLLTHRGLFKGCRHFHLRNQLATMSTGPRIVDVRSDTFTKPTAAMREAMAVAEVGDDVYKEDPTVNELERQSAILLGKEAALFVPSGTMGNLIAVMVHCQGRGIEILIGDQSHMFLYEQGGAAHIAGVQPATLITKPDATFDLEEIRQKIHPGCQHVPRTGLICFENTHNQLGGQALPPSYLNELGKLKSEYSIPFHLDGARIMNAAVYSKVSPAELCRHFDSVSFCLSKGLRSPIGSLIVGTKQFIEKAILIRRMLGGGLRQVGVLAAAGLISINSMIDRLEEDHKLAKQIAQAISTFGSDVISVNENTVQTNMVYIRVNPKYMLPEEFSRRLSDVTENEKRATSTPTVVKLCPMGLHIVRLVIHADVTGDDVEAAINKIKYVIDDIKQQNQV